MVHMWDEEQTSCAWYHYSFFFSSREYCSSGNVTTIKCIGEYLRSPHYWKLNYDLEPANKTNKNINQGEVCTSSITGLPSRHVHCQKNKNSVKSKFWNSEIQKFRILKIQILEFGNLEIGKFGIRNYRNSEIQKCKYPNFQIFAFFFILNFPISDFQICEFGIFEF